MYFETSRADQIIRIGIPLDLECGVIAPLIRITNLDGKRLELRNRLLCVGSPSVGVLYRRAEPVRFDQLFLRPRSGGKAFF